MANVKLKDIFSTPVHPETNTNVVYKVEGGSVSSTNLTTYLDSLNNNVVSHINNKSNPHSVTKAQVGLSNVDNTSDINKPISTPTQNALNTKPTIPTSNANTSGQIVVLDKNAAGSAIVLPAGGNWFYYGMGFTKEGILKTNSLCGVEAGGTTIYAGNGEVEFFRGWAWRIN